MNIHKCSQKNAKLDDNTLTIIIDKDNAIKISHIEILVIANLINQKMETKTNTETLEKYKVGKNTIELIKQKLE